ncbi:hypothetical protein CLV58_109209 [Spirosoma oryzae]|uniref:Uncharacterized protein n=1 Tax=Spirosoma oryzae TaxID=1469603 RepID=A0A2T0SYI8_9BACT|nr:hypothetical protein [Spirosoma oryzae]PRY38482.1 hypothetical protein CLV58_109209 [Spirosoma oryzae]
MTAEEEQKWLLAFLNTTDPDQLLKLIRDFHFNSWKKGYEECEIDQAETDY